MPVMEVAAEMELTGVEIDKEYAERLSNKYHKLVNDVEVKIAEQLENYRPAIEKWRLTEDANFHPLSKKPNKNGEYTKQKSKNEQLKDPPELSSPAQFAILLYDVLKTPVVDKKSPRGTGEEILVKIDNPLYRQVLSDRYIAGNRWDVISESAGYTCRQIFRIHGYALQEIDKIIQDVTKCH